MKNRKGFWDERSCGQLFFSDQEVGVKCVERMSSLLVGASLLEECPSTAGNASIFV